MVKKFIFSFCLLCFICGYGQKNDSNSKDSYFVTPEFLIGKTIPANTFFPKANLQTALFIDFGKNNFKNPNEWASWLYNPKTGVYLGISDFGNTEKLGKSYTLMPYIEFGFSKWGLRKLNMRVGMGGAYIDTQHDPVTNEFNRAITTELTWAFRAFLYYDVYAHKNMTFRIGGGISHLSNGHIRLPNQGLNALLLSVSSRINLNPERDIDHETFEKKTFERTLQYYYSIRTGIGQQTLLEAEEYNTKKEVYSAAISAGKIYNKVLKVGVGFSYRFYEHYYDYIKENELEDYIDHPYRNSTNFNVFIGAELLLSHVGLEWQMGFNIYKPFYKEQWLLTEEDGLNWYYEIKKALPSRLGLKLYALNTNKSPKNNFFIGANINSNFGQADFNELSFGYVHSLSIKKRN